MSPFRKALAALLLFTAASIDCSASELAASETQIQPILLGSTLPDVSVMRLDGKSSTLKSVVNGGPAVLVFYRGGWCPYCTLQMNELQKIEGDLQALGYQVIAISPDRPEELNQTLEKNSLKYTLVSDGSTNAMKAFGVAYKVDNKTFKQYRDWGIDLDKRSGTQSHALPVPAVFIVDAQGFIQFSYVHPNYKIRAPGQVVLAAARAIAEQKHKLQP
ncbi:MAG: peroxiredoxin-like family protein [Tahibacter sp.]